MTAKPIFKRVEEAKAALMVDKLGCVYITSKDVFVATAFGFGKFTREEWDRDEREGTGSFKS